MTELKRKRQQDTPSDVAGCIVAIDSIYSDGYELLNSIYGRFRSYRRSLNELLNLLRDMQDLESCLVHGQEAMQTQYDREYRRYGIKFANGDEIAREALKEIIIYLQSRFIFVLQVQWRKHTLVLDFGVLHDLLVGSTDRAINALLQLQQRIQSLKPLPTSFYQHSHGTHLFGEMATSRIHSSAGSNVLNSRLNSSDPEQSSTGTSTSVQSDLLSIQTRTTNSTDNKTKSIQSRLMGWPEILEPGKEIVMVNDLADPPSDRIQSTDFVPEVSLSHPSPLISATLHTEARELRDHTSQTAPPLSRLGNVRQFVRNPAAYFEDLKDLEAQVASCHSIASMFERRSDQPGTWRTFAEVVPGSDLLYPDKERLCYVYDALEQNRKLNEGTIQGLQLLRKANFAGSIYSIIVKDQDRSQVARVIPISDTTLRSVEDLIKSALNEVELHFRPSPLSVDWQSIDEVLLPLGEVSGLLLSYLGLAGSKLLGATPENSPSIAILQRLTAINQTLLLGLISYTRSHAGNFDRTLVAENCAAFEIDFRSGSVSLSRQRLSCLDAFIQGPIWVFDLCPVSSTADIYLSSMLADFVDLWGPARLIYADEVAGDVFEIETLRGSIRATPLDGGRQLQVGEEILCHWCGWSDDYFVNQRSLQTFDHTKPLLIGVLDPHFRPNTTCRCNEQHFAKTLQRIPLGTKGASYKDDARSITFSVAKYVGLAFGKSQKLHPAITIKDQVIDEWVIEPRVNSNFLPDPSYLDWHIGLEISKCTGNARRLTLWEILSSVDVVKHVVNNYPRGELFRSFCFNRQFCAGFWVDIAAESRQPILSIIHTLIRRLQSTGVDDRDGELTAWDVSTATIGVKLRPAWAGMLQNSGCCGTFAVLLNRCLEYEYGTKCADGQHTSVNDTHETVLHTSLIVSFRQPTGSWRSNTSKLSPNLTPARSERQQNSELQKEEGAIRYTKPPDHSTSSQLDGSGIGLQTDWRAAEASRKRVTAIDAQIAAITRPSSKTPQQSDLEYQQGPKGILSTNQNEELNSAVRPESRPPQSRPRYGPDAENSLNLNRDERHQSKILFLYGRTWPLQFGPGKLHLCPEWFQPSGIKLDQTYKDTPIRVTWSGAGIFDKADGIYAQADARLQAQINGMVYKYSGATLSNKATPSFQEFIVPQTDMNERESFIFVCVS